MKRRNFLQAIVMMPFVVGFLQSCRKKISWAGKITGASASIGHLLRNKLADDAVSEVLRKKVVIIGSGISGLSAARQLIKKNITDFIILELESYPGGNASFGKNEISAYPQGAHYVPIPNNYLEEYISFLQENNVITGFDENHLPFFNEFYLCFDAQERLFVNGKWQEGIIPKRGLQAAELKEIEQFLVLMNNYRELKGVDGKYAFDIPADQSSRDKELKDLDTITMKTWLLQHNLRSQHLHWYVNYCTRDDFATTYDTVSAWAGIHYFASRKGKAANAAGGDVLTWPEGNGFLMNCLLETCKQKIRVNALATSVKAGENGVQVIFMDTITKKTISIEASQCIMACPQYVSARLLQNEGRKALVKGNYFYTPWLVANIKTDYQFSAPGTTLSWDNVVYDSPSLGYVDATHQLLQQVTQTKNITYYLPLTNGDPSVERTRVSLLTHDNWCELVMDDMEKVHPGIREKVQEINITLWGHSMVQPCPGFMFGKVKEQMAQAIGNKIFFAHTDNAGISIFEEAFYQGLNAAKQIS